MSAKRRNEIRRYRAGIFEKVGLGLLALGVLQPLFGDRAMTPWLSTAALLASVAFLGLGDYILRRLEDEK